jgi:hypothetical protein
MNTYASEYIGIEIYAGAGEYACMLACIYADTSESACMYISIDEYTSYMHIYTLISMYACIIG